MKFKLTGLKHIASMSQETHCFTATLSVDGTRFCTVENQGQGGCNMYHSLNNSKITQSELYRRIGEINNELSKEILTTEYGPLTNDLEIVVGDLVNDALKEKEIKKLLKRISYMKGDDLYQLPAKFKPTPENIAGVQKTTWWNKSCKLLNGLPMNKLMELPL